MVDGGWRLAAGDSINLLRFEYVYFTLKREQDKAAALRPASANPAGPAPQKDDEKLGLPPGPPGPTNEPSQSMSCNPTLAP